MKVDRRSFLSFLIGGAAGTALSPMPWKLTDDSAIWTQMWPWTPVPEDGEINHVNSTCTLCPGRCGITVLKIDNRAIKIEGMKGHPVNDGGICLLGLSGLQLLYGPTRVKTPLKRVGAKGAGHWEKISWDEAVAEVVKQLGDLRARGQSHLVGLITGSDRGTVPQLFTRFMTAYGSPNSMRTPSMLDSYELTLQLTQGTRALPGFDFENADFILSFGSGIIDGWGSPVRMFKAHSSWRSGGGKVIQVEPRLSRTAAKSDRWIPVKPGTEGALALGLAHVIVKESLYNADFVDNYTVGFEDLQRLVLDKYSPESVAAITAIDQKDIVALARDFAAASKPLAICGRGRGTVSGSLDEFMAVHVLNALAGNINQKGGIRAFSEIDYINWPQVQKDAVAAAGMQHERLDGAGSKKYPDARSLLNRLPAAVRPGAESPLQALLVTDANPLYTMPGSTAVKKAMADIPFVVSFSSFMDETAQNADLILPNHIYLERYEDVPTPFGLQQPVTSLARPVVEPQFNTQHVGDIVIRIAKALGGSIAGAFPWDGYQTCLKETLGHKWETLMAKGFRLDNNYGAPAWQMSFNTPSGKFEFANKETGRVPQYTPIKIEGDKKLYPLVLIPYDSFRLFSGYIGDPPFAVKTVEDTVIKGQDVFVELNPETARALRLREGQHAILSTPRGQAKVKVHWFDGIRPGVVALPRGLGHTAYDKYLAEKGVNFNELIGPVEDPETGYDAAWGIMAKLSKA
ncbi:MAG: menaquinone reductase molybdopterin-binding-like subunit QrcB [Candidatus Desulfatibia sp.]|uniref:menaquinone reductase molybdopterin-binding-like subunit QrcB n=1 Tax=Candidatus Desulfatibia sp. TaxID=3101189 RepID=UPI002F2F3BB7